MSTRALEAVDLTDLTPPCDGDPCDKPAAWAFTWAPAPCGCFGRHVALTCDCCKKVVESFLDRGIECRPCGGFMGRLREYLESLVPIGGKPL